MALFDPPTDDQLNKASGGLFKAPTPEELTAIARKGNSAAASGGGLLPTGGAPIPPIDGPASDTSAVAVGTPTIKSGATDDEIIAAFHYDPSIKESPLWFDGVLSRIYKGERDPTAPPELGPKSERIATAPGAAINETADSAEAILSALARASSAVTGGVGKAIPSTNSVKLIELHRLARMNKQLRNVESGRRVDSQGNKKFSAEELVGGSLVPSPLPRIAALGRYNAPLKGAVAGATSPQDIVSPDPGSEESAYGATAATRAGVGAAAGPIVGGALKLGANVAGRIANMRNVLPQTSESKVLEERLNKERIQHTLGDIEPDAPNVRGIEDLITPASARVAQREGARAAVDRRVGALANEFKNEPFVPLNAKGKPDLGAIRAAARSANHPHGREARAVLDFINNPSEDWTDHVHLDARLRVLQAELKSFNLYRKFDKDAKGVSNVPDTQYAKAITDLYNKRVGEKASGQTNRYADELKKMVNDLNRTRQAPTTMQEAAKIRKNFADLATPDAPGDVAADIQKLRDAVFLDMSTAARKAGRPDLTVKLKEADNLYKETSGIKSTIVAQALENGKFADEIVPIFKRARTNGGFDRARELYESLGPKGRKAVEYGLLSDALGESFHKNRFDPVMFYQNMHAQEKLYGVFLDKADPHGVNGIVNMMQFLDRTGLGGAEVNAQRLGRSGLASAGVAATGGWSGSRAVLSQILGGIGLNAAINSPMMRKFWLASGDLGAGHPDMKRIAILLTGALNRETTSNIAEAVEPGG